MIDINTIGTIFSFIGMILGGLVIVPYLINRVYYRPHVIMKINDPETDGQKILTNNKGQIMYTLTTRNKQRIIVSVWVSLRYAEGLTSFAITDVFGMPAPIEPLTVITPKCSTFPFLIRDTIISKGKGQAMSFGYLLEGKNLETIEMQFTVRSHIYDGDLPPLIDMFPPKIREQTTFETFQIISDSNKTQDQAGS